jgi:hypothetical protein
MNGKIWHEWPHSRELAMKAKGTVGAPSCFTICYSFFIWPFGKTVQTLITVVTLGHGLDRCLKRQQSFCSLNNYQDVRYKKHLWAELFFVFGWTRKAIRVKKCIQGLQLTALLSAEGQKLSAICYDLNDCLDLPFSETHIYIYFAQVLKECIVL